MDNKVLTEIKNVLGKCEKYLDENNEILKSKVQSDVLNMNEELISLLVNNEILNKTFFKNINGTLVFDKVSFSWTINSSEFLPNSFTAFKNKIGLVDENNNFIKQYSDVVLSFPYRDCVLEFDSTVEDEQRDEVYLNETLCKSDIDSIFEPKIFANAVKHTSAGNSDIDVFDDENLIIKGNNLISMRSLLPRYEGKIKFMYWDVLYNTNSDRVPYNDSFKRSSWLVMMKNRLEVAERLLSPDGVIVIQLDYNEQAYLKVLMDDIFKNGYVSMITVKTSSESGVKVNANKPIKTAEYLLMYCKNKEKFNYIHPRIKLNTYEKNYSYYVEDVNLEPSEWEIFNLKDKAAEFYNVAKSKLSNEQLLQFQIDNSERVFSVRDISDALKKYIKDNNIDKNSIYTYVTSTGKKTLLYKNGEVVFIKNKVIYENGKPYLSKMASDIWTDIAWDGIAGEGSTVLKNGKKPERLIHRLLGALTKQSDLVLDAYFGTGTTGAVAMKMGRKFIGLEQLDSHYNKSIARMEGVIKGDPTGVSKDVNWQGGGEFISCELLKQNELWIDLIKDAVENNIDVLYDEILNNPFVVNYKVDIDLMKTAATRDKFIELSLADKKKVLIALVDKNNLYVNYSDRDDKRLGVPEQDIKFSKSFYGEE